MGGGVKLARPSFRNFGMVPGEGATSSIGTSFIAPVEEELYSGYRSVSLFYI